MAADRTFFLYDHHDDRESGDGWDWRSLMYDDYRQPSSASVEGDSAEWIAIANAIRERTSVSFARCAVESVVLVDAGDRETAKGAVFYLWSPRNCVSDRGRAELSSREADALAAWIEEHVKVPPPAPGAEPAAESTTSSASTGSAPSAAPPHVERREGFDEALAGARAEVARLVGLIDRGQRQVDALQAELKRCRELLLHQTRVGLGRYVLGEIDVPAGRCCILITDDDDEETIAQGVVAHLIPLLRAQGLKVADDAKPFTIPEKDDV